MEEDIKYIDYEAVIQIIEDFLKKEKTEILGISVGEEHQLRMAIENLIAKNKELEKEKEEMAIFIEKQELELYSSIPKSRVKEKIGIKMQKNNNIIHNYKKKYGKDFYWYDEVQQANAENYIYKGILQELLED